MTQGFSGGLVLPALVLMGLGWLVPRLLGRIWPEGAGALLLLGVVATLVLLTLATGLFVLLYGWQGAPLAELFAPGLLPGLGHFVALGLMSALLWAPIMILTVASLPKHWVKETW